MLLSQIIKPQAVRSIAQMDSKKRLLQEISEIITIYNSDNESESIVKASELAGQDNLLFIRNSQSGAIEARINSKSVSLNQTLHKN